MVRVHLATATLIEGRLMHVRIFLKRTIDFLIVYQYAWNPNMLGIHVMALNPSFKSANSCG